MVRESYTDLINYVSTKTGKSYNMSWKVAKEFSLVVKEAIKRGDTVNIEGFVTIFFTTKYGNIYRNKEYALDDQVEDIKNNLGMNRISVKNILVTYIKRMRERVLDGYQVNLKGVCYLIPNEEQGEVMCVPRVSPVLDKPEIADFVITTESGLELSELEDEDLRFKIEVNEDIEYVYDIVKEEKQEGIELKQADI